MRKILAGLALVIGLFIGLSVQPAEARKAYLSDVVVAPGRNHFLLFFNVTECFSEEMVKAIENGINTTFTFFIKLYEVRDYWWDKKIADIKVSHEVHYDGLKKAYNVKLSEKEDRAIVVNDFEEAKKLMSEIRGLGIAEFARLQKGQRYRVDMMAELDKIRLPFHLHYVFFFLSLWDFKTDWHSEEFKY